MHLPHIDIGRTRCWIQRSSAAFLLMSLLACGQYGGKSTANDGTIIPPVSNGSLTLLAGNIGGAGNINGTANAARFRYPSAVVADSTGNLYVADTANYVIRKISSTGGVTNFAGISGSSAYVDGSASIAQFSNPLAISIDGAGNLYVADGIGVDASGKPIGNTIRKITPSGTVSTLAGQSGVLLAADGIGTAAGFEGVVSILADSSGNVYVADTHSVRKVTVSGQVTTLAGAAQQVGNNDGQGSTARFSSLHGIAMDNSGNLYVSDYYDQSLPGGGGGNKLSYGGTIRKINTNGVVSTFAGTAGVRGNADGQAASAQFRMPAAMTSDTQGNLYVMDRNGQSGSLLRKVSVNAVVTTVLGNNLSTSGATDGSAGIAQFSAGFLPAGISFDSGGSLYIPDSGNHTIRKLDGTGMVTTVAGAAALSGSVDAAGANARFTTPSSLAVDSGGGVNVADAGNSIRKIMAGGTAYTLAGNAYQSGYLDGLGTYALFSRPVGVTLDIVGNLYVADRYNSLIRRIDANLNVTTFAGSPGISGFIDGTGAAAQFYGLSAITSDAQQNLYVVDGNAIRKITAAAVVTTLAGTNASSGSQGAGSTDGSGSLARFNWPAGIASDAGGTLYVADTNNNTIRKISTSGVVSTIAGKAGVAGYADGASSVALFNQPAGIAVDGSGNVYVADTNNNLIRKISTAGVVSTIVGQAGSVGIATGALPGSLSHPLAVAVTATGLLITCENAVLKVTFGS